jgi:hypothetical protein
MIVSMDITGSNSMQRKVHSSDIFSIFGSYTFYEVCIIYLFICLFILLFIFYLFYYLLLLFIYIFIFFWYIFFYFRLSFDC